MDSFAIGYIRAVGNVAALTVCAHFFEEGLELRLLVLLEFLRGLTGRCHDLSGPKMFSCVA